VEAEPPALADYVFEEFWAQFENTGGFVLVDRRNLEKIRAEMDYQLSGEVDDNTARSIGRQYGAQTIVYGKITPLAGEYRMVMYATDVEQARSSMRACGIRADAKLTALLNAGGGLDAEIDRAVLTLGRGLNSRLRVGIGRISLNGTGTVTNISDYLKRNIGMSASRQGSKYEVASDSESAAFAVASRGLTVEAGVPGSPVDAVVSGSFSPLGADAEVSLQLVSTRNNALVGAAKFVISGDELQRRGLSLLPQKDGAVITQAEFNAKQKAIAPYDGAHNAFKFTVTADDLDGVYHDGEYMTMRVYAERDCYFKIIHIDVNGAAQVIYPTSTRDDNFIKAGAARRIPDNTRFRLVAPFGEEYILAAAYERPFTLSSTAAGPLSDALITRGLIVQDEATRADTRPAATAKFSYTILP
jgi:hypothetical protein